MKTETGGPAFPEVAYKQPEGGGAHIMTICGGMTLRDYFAARADLGAFKAGLKEGELLAGRPCPPDSDPVDQLRWQFEIVAAAKYLAADAMIAAREQEKADAAE